MCNPNMSDMYNHGKYLELESWLQDHGFDEPQPVPFVDKTQDIQEANQLLTPDIIEEIDNIVVDANLENIDPNTIVELLKEEETIDNASIDLEQSDTFSSSISCPGSVNTICTEFTPLENAILSNSPDIMQLIDNCLADLNLENINPIAIDEPLKEEDTIDEAPTDLERTDAILSNISSPSSCISFTESASLESIGSNTEDELLKEQDTIDEAPTDLEKTDAILSNISSPSSCISFTESASLESIDSNTEDELLKEEIIDETPTNLDQTGRAPLCISSAYSVNCMTSGSTSLENGSVSTSPGMKVNDNLVVDAELENIDSSTEDELLKVDTIDANPTDVQRCVPYFISSEHINPIAVNDHTDASLSNISSPSSFTSFTESTSLDSNKVDELLKEEIIDESVTHLEQFDASSSSKSSAGNLDSTSSEDIAAENSITADIQFLLECVENGDVHESVIVKDQDLALECWSQTRKRKAGDPESSMPAAKKAKPSTASLPEDIDPSELLNAADEAPTYLEHSDASSSSISSIDTDGSTSPNGAAQPSASLPEKTDKAAVRRRNNNIASRNYRTLRQQRKQELFAREQELLNSNAQLNAQAQQLAHEIEPYIKVIFIYLVVLIVFQVRYGSTI